MKTHYDVLGVPFGADYETIKAAYRKALKAYHPDLHEGNAAAERLSKRIIDAHTVLKDPDQRALYDEYVLHHRQQRRRLLLITAMLSAGLACGGGLVLLDRSLRSEASSDRIASADALVAARKTERVAKAKNPSAMAALSPNEMSDASSYVAVAPQPPKDVAKAESPSVTAALSPNEMEVLSSATIVPPPPREIAEGESPAVRAALALSRLDASPSMAIVPMPPTGIVKAESPSPGPPPSPREVDNAPSDAAVVPTPPEGVTEPPHEVAVAVPAEKSLPAGAQLETAWADIEKRGDAEEILKFTQAHLGTPASAMAERWLEKLIETTEDVTSLEALRAVAMEPIASKISLRLDMLAASNDIIAGALPEESGETQQPEITPLPVMVPAPEAGSPPEETVDQTVGITPRDPKKHAKKGMALLKAGDHDRAIASLNNAILLDPPNAGYLLYRAAAWEAKGDLDQALADYDAAVSLDQTNISTFRARGLLWHRRGDNERALADLDRAIRLSFSDAKIYHDRGMIWYEMGRYNRAIADFTHAIRLDPNFASAYVSRGQAFQKKGDPVTAAINFEKAVIRDPAIGKVHRDLFQGRPEKGERKAPQAAR